MTWEGWGSPGVASVHAMLCVEKQVALMVGQAVQATGRVHQPSRSSFLKLCPLLAWAKTDDAQQRKETHWRKFLGQAPGGRSWSTGVGVTSATSTVNSTSVKRGDASMQRDAAGLVSRMLVTCGTFLLVASFIVKRKEGHQLRVRVAKSC